MSFDFKNLYTNIPDVYKRQVWRAKQDNVIRHRSAPRRITHIQSTRTVSYTHLDVYKRQLHKNLYSYTKYKTNFTLNNNYYLY